jgi:hypothetical protein
MTRLKSKYLSKKKRDSKKADIVEPSGSDWVIRSKKNPKKILGKFPTKEAAQKRLKQIEYYKQQKPRGDSVVKRFDKLGWVHTDATKKDQGFYAEETPEGFLRVKGKITRTGVFLYQDIEGNEWGEYRSPDEVFCPESMKSFEMVILTDDHPREMVNAQNCKRYQVGHVGNNIVREGDYLVADILVTDPKVIEAIKNGKIELSCGYYVLVLDEPGITEDGITYDKRQTEIRGNHLALVDEGRAGPECRLQLDAKSAYSEAIDMNRRRKKKSANKDAMMKFGDQEFQVPDGFAEMFKELQAKAASTADPASSAEAPMEETSEDMEDMLSGEEDLMVDQMESEEGAMDEEMLPEEKSMDQEEEPKAPAMDEGDLPEEEALDQEEEEKKAMDSLLRPVKKTAFDHKAVGQYLALLDDARSILGKRVKSDHSPSFLKRACIYKVCPSLRGNFDKASSEAIDGAYRVAKAVFAKKGDARRTLNKTMFDSIGSLDSKTPRALAALDARSNRHNKKGNK